MDLYYCRTGTWKVSIYQAINIPLTFIILTWVQVLKYLDWSHVCSRKKLIFKHTLSLAKLLATDKDGGWVHRNKGVSHLREITEPLSQISWSLDSLVVQIPKHLSSDNLMDHIWATPYQPPTFKICIYWCGILVLYLTPSPASCIGL